jgi:hypothetical protein
MARWWMGLGMGRRFRLARRLGAGLGMLGLRLGLGFWVGSSLESLLVLAFVLLQPVAGRRQCGV